ncbi:unnamed protein product [Blepharisma stoltei]|uniref:Uncharacterized protein n=1 Tax=Blepharisma stoltei TaxID=1481888 RepID=A0AAU9IZB3_9CILI|nr:unnamed protein product [Blepharisma stoltei]
MLSKVIARFNHWGQKRFGKKRRFNPNLNIKTPVVLPPRHDFINFKQFTGNEILYHLKDADAFRDGELSCALLELGLRKGAPEGYDWNTHENVKKAIAQATKKAPEYNCLVLTSLAHACSRLKINDQALWSALERNINRIIHSIKPIGMAYTFNSFIETGSPEFYEKLVEVAPIHIKYINGRDLLNVVRGCVKRNILAEKLFSKWIYPILLEKKKMCSPVQLEEYLQLLSKRTDFTPEIKAQLEDALQYKIAYRARMDTGQYIS